jgi:hypothetical protein
MPLDPDSARKVSEWITARGFGACPVCKGEDWGASLRGLTTVPTPLSADHHLSAARAGQALYVALTCHGCGYTLLLRASRLGIAAPEAPHGP